MEIIWYIFTAYAAVAVLVAARLGWHMAMRLDHFDWFYNKSEIWAFSVFMSLLWPVLLCMPQMLIKPDELFDEINYSIAMREREETMHLLVRPRDPQALAGRGAADRGGSA